MTFVLPPDLMEVVDKWGADQYVDPSVLDRSVGRLTEELTRQANDLRDGEFTHWQNVIGLMNRDLRKLETKRRFLREGIVQ